MLVKFKKLHEKAVMPSKANKSDAGFDLVAVTSTLDKYGNVEYGTGLAVEIPEGYVGFIFPRSSIYKKYLSLTNSVGVIDSGYRGEIKFKFHPNNQNSFSQETQTDYNVGDRIGQLIIMPYPEIEFVEHDNLSDSDRGSGGFGSSGD